MKRFVIRLLIFVTPIMIVLGLWEYGLSGIKNSYSLKKTQLETQAPNIEVLVLGPSHALRGVNPAYFSMKGYNAANVEQSLFYDTRITLRYLNKMTSLKVVLVDISYPSLWMQVHDGPEPFRDYFYADYWNIRYPEIKWYDIHIYSKILHYGNTRAWQYALKGFNVNLAKGYFDNGWAIKAGEESPINDSLGSLSMNERKKKFKPENLADNITYLKDLLSALHNRNIHTIFFTPPVTSSNYRFMDTGRLKTIDSVLHNLCTSYNCEWYNYLEDQRFTNDDFKDLSHLNENGGIKFSKIIQEEILRKFSNPMTKQ